jgi:hypothetical protein
MMKTFLWLLVGGCMTDRTDVVQQSESTSGGDDPCVSDPIAPGRDPMPDPNALCHRPGTTRQQATLDSASNAARHAGYSLGTPPSVTTVACDEVACELVWDFPDGSGFWLETQCPFRAACTSQVCWFIIGDGSPHCLVIEP